MKYIFFINIFFLFWGKFNRIAEMNELKEQAAIDYEKKHYSKCILTYKKLLSEFTENDETVNLNIAHCYYHLKKYNNAIDNYKLLLNSKNPVLKSTAYLQLGVIYSSNNKKDLGLSYFKEALKSMPSNEEARYNFELLRKDHDRQQKENSPDKKKENQDGKNKTTYGNSEESKKSTNGADKKDASIAENNDEESSEEGDNENTGGEEEEEFQFQNNGNKETDALTSKRLEEMSINERQARMILKTMKNTEIQYLQQQKKILSTKPVLGRPDW